MEEATAIIQGNDNESVEHENSNNCEGDVGTKEIVQNEENQIVKTEAYSGDSQQEENGYGDGNTNWSLEPGLILVILSQLYLCKFFVQFQALVAKLCVGN